MNPTTEKGRPSEAQTTPAAPLMSAGVASPRRALANAIVCSATAWAPRTSCDAPRRQRSPIGSEHDVWVEDRDQGPEVALAGGGEEGVDDLSLAAEVGVREWGRSLDPAAGAARELPGRGRGALDDRRDLIEGHGEHVMEDEREPLGGSQGVEHDEQRQPDRVGEQRLMLGVDVRPRG